MTKKRSRKHEKLTVKRETLKRLTRTLSEQDLEAVNGAAPCALSIIPTGRNP